MSFVNAEHKERYEELLRRGRIDRDVERCVVMYIVSGNDDLYSKVNELYDFKKNQILFDLKESENGEEEILWKAYLSSSQEKLMLLALSLYSGRNHVGVVELFRTLDSNNKKLALNAISMRF